MSQTHVNPEKSQFKSFPSSNQELQAKLDRSGSSQEIKDIFEVMQKNFDQTFNVQIPKEIPSIPTENISCQQNKESIQSQRSARKVKPIYSQVTKKLSQNNPSVLKSQSNESDSKLASESQVINCPSADKKNRSAQNQQNESPQMSNKSSPYTKIMNRLHQSITSEFQPNQQNSTSILNLESERDFESQEGIQNHTLRSPKSLNYKQLQQKIESALKKNSHYKKFGTPSRLTKTNQTSRTFNEFNELLLSRFEEYQKNRQRQIQQKKAEIQQRKQKQLKFHPKINKKSLQFIEQMGGHQPLEHRYQKILEIKNKRIQQNEEQRRKKEEEEYEQFMEEFLKHQKSPEDNTRSYDEFYEEMFKWKQRSMKKAEEKRKMIEEQKLEQTNKFQPKINKKSQKIVMNSAKSQKYIPIYQRQIPAQKKFKSKIDEECTFKPKINKRKVK